MQLFGFYREQKLQSFISLFGVHATCLGNSLKAYDGDNKGYAAAFSELVLSTHYTPHWLCVHQSVTICSCSHPMNWVTLLGTNRGDGNTA